MEVTRIHDEFELPRTKPTDMVEKLRLEHPEVIEAVNQLKAVFGDVQLAGFDDQGVKWKSREGKRHDEMTSIDASEFIRLGEI